MTADDTRHGDFPLSAFDLKRRSNPAAAFAEMLSWFRSAARDGGELAQAAKLFKGGVFVRQEEAARLAAFEKRGLAASDFRVGSLPPELGPGLALMYDAALEVLRSSDRRIRPEGYQPRSAARVVELIQSLLPVIGAASVAALEMASTDQAFAGRLKERALQFSGAVWDRGSPANGVAEFGGDPVVDPDECEYCVIVVNKEGQDPDIRCGTQAACDGLLWAILSLFIIKGLEGLLDWLFEGVW